MSGGDVVAKASLDLAHVRGELFRPEAACDVTVLVPAYNEAESLPELVARLRAALEPITERYEILVVDDGSHDGTAEVLRQLRAETGRVRVKSFLRNYGKSAALAVGFGAARGSVVVTIDADLQDDPDEIPFLIAKLAEGWDLVSGWKQNRQDPFIKTSTSKLFNAVTRQVSGLHLHDFNCGLKAYRQPVAKSLRVYGELHRYLPVLAHVQGFRVTEMPVRHHERRFGETKFGRSRFVNGLLDLLTVMFISRQRTSPLHFFGRLGLIFGGVGSMILLYFLGVWIVEHALRLRPLMLVGVALVLVGVQFVSLGLLGELFVASRDSMGQYQFRDEDEDAA